MNIRKIFLSMTASVFVPVCLFSGTTSFGTVSTETKSAEIMAPEAVASGTVSYILPSKMTQAKSPSILLNGVWQFRYSVESKWSTIQVPGEAVMQGYAIEHDKPFWYKRIVTLPADFNGQRTILRFDGVYSYARLMVNGKFVSDHHGGFTRWETDVTDFVRPGKKNEIMLEVTDRLDDISYASGYAHHPIGGILRDVTIFALPQTHISDFRIETLLDTLYRDAVLQLNFMTHAMDIAHTGNTSNAIGKVEIKYTLTDPDGKNVTLRNNTFPLTDAEPITHRIPVDAPQKWDAEHPNLYTLTVALHKDDQELYRFNRKVGFRDVQIKGDKMLVNGMPVKLRGACRHDIHPTLGRTTTAELDSLDAVLFKKSNMNFVRTSHYPPSEKFLEYCDRFGIYVECETAVCFVNTYRQKNYAPGKTQDSLEFKERYLSQYQEMVKSFSSHPSILFWSIGNESVYGANFQQCWDWSKQYDQTRPVVFSYPGSTKNNKIYDILSMHYQDVYGNLSQWGMTTRNFQGHGIPALFDEWAHPACYTYATLQEDPNIREFWGKSIDMMWDGLFPTSGGLGGAIWGYIDETFMVPPLKVGTPFWKEFAKTAKPEGYQGNCVGYGEWGIVDVWRREKPEFWATQKAHSPVRLLQEKISNFTPKERLFIPIYNRFDHTDLNEIICTYNYKGNEKNIHGLSLEPHKKGILIIPGEDWEEGETITVKVMTKDRTIIDISKIRLGEEKITYPKGKYKGDLSIEETSDRLIIKGNGFTIPFNKETGLIENAVSGGKTMIEKGPFLHMDINLNHLTGAEVRKSASKFLVRNHDWTKKSLSWKKENNQVNVQLSGYYDQVLIDMSILIYPEGQMDIHYLTTGQPNGYIREFGLKFYLPASFDYLKWKRDGYWSYYPENSFAGNEGEAPFYSTKQVAYGKKPVTDWSSDTRNYYYWADAGANVKEPLTQKAKGMKENIRYYTLSIDNEKNDPASGLSVISKDASVACRTNKTADEQLILYINNQWDYPEIAWGNYCKTLEAIPGYGKISIVF